MQNHSFRHPAAASVFLASALGLAVPASAQPPTPVSPGDAEGGAVVQSRCPTFSWTGIEGVRGYELALYRLVEEAGAEGATEAEAEPELLARVRLPAGSTGWTPSLGRCPERGGSYAWSVRALETARPGEWSQASLFEVRGMPSAAEVEAAVQTLRRYLRAEGGAEDAGPTSAESARGGRSTGQGPEERRAPPLRRIVPRDGEAALSPKAAPSLSSPSLTVDSDIALGSGSDLFKDGEVFLWNDSSGNLALGGEALASASLVSHSTAVGNRALTSTFNNSTFSNRGSFNVAVGSLALTDNTIGLGNTAVGAFALDDNTTGDNNTAIGRRALGSVTTGERNIALGSSAGSSLGLGDTTTSLSRNIYIGNNGENDEANTIRIGNGFDHDRTFIAGISGVGVSGGDVHVASDGQLGVSTSSRRFKEEVEALEEGLTQRLLELEPVTFRYRPELVAGGGDLEVGLVAEDVARVFPELVIRDQEGRPFGVRYELLSVLLLEELQRRHAQDEARREELAALRERLTALEEGRPPAEDETPWWRRIFGSEDGSP